MIIVLLLLAWILIRSMRHSPINTSDVVLGIIVIVWILTEVFS